MLVVNKDIVAMSKVKRYFPSDCCWIWHLSDFLFIFLYKVYSTGIAFFEITIIQFILILFNYWKFLLYLGLLISTILLDNLRIENLNLCDRLINHMLIYNYLSLRLIKNRLLQNMSSIRFEIYDLIIVGMSLIIQFKSFKSLIMLGLLVIA